MRSSNRTLLPVLVLTALLTASATGRADDSETFFAQGRTLRAEGKCAEAVVVFRRALDLKPQGLGSLRNVAECEEQLGEFASARTDWWNLRRAALQSNEPRYAGWDKDAESAYARLEPKVARLTVRLAGADLDRVRVAIDGKPLDPRLLGVELERDLGPHTIEAFYGGASPVVEKRELSVGGRETVTLAIPSPPAAKPGPVASLPTEEGPRPLRVAGIATLTVGGLGLVGAAIALGVRRSALAAFDVCAPGYQGCPAALHDQLGKGRTASTLVNVFGVVALAGIAAGVPMVVIGSGTSTTGEPAPPRAELGVAPTFGGAVLRAGARF